MWGAVRACRHEEVKVACSLRAKNYDDEEVLPSCGGIFVLYKSTLLGAKFRIFKERVCVSI